MREQPWNRRLASTHHYRRFDELAELHRLTRSWSGPAPESSSLPFPELAGLLERLGLENDAPLALEELMDDTSPDTLLDRLEQLVWVAQARSVERSGTEESRRTASFECGRQTGARIWKDADAGVRADLRGILSATRSAPLFREGSFLVIRSTASEFDAEWLRCPHQDPRAEVRQAADTLCRLHLAWFEGFLSALQPAIRIETHPASRAEGGSRCRLRCRLT